MEELKKFKDPRTIQQIQEDLQREKALGSQLKKERRQEDAGAAGYENEKEDVVTFVPKKKRKKESLKQEINPVHQKGKPLMNKSVIKRKTRKRKTVAGTISSETATNALGGVKEEEVGRKAPALVKEEDLRR